MIDRQRADKPNFWFRDGENREMDFTCFLIRDPRMELHIFSGGTDSKGEEEPPVPTAENLDKAL